MKGELVVFLGPSLPAAEARRLAPRCTILPPARQGDLWRALEGRPKVIALIDGIFESAPSVWHHEVLAALSAGVRVLGASSMGALRAAELHPYGMEGVGEIVAAFRSGRLSGDDEVALLHADAELDYRPMTVPLVNVRHSAAVALREGRLGPGAARRLVKIAAGMHYQSRTWRGVLKEAGLPADLPLVDLKAADARACLAAATKALEEHSSEEVTGPLVDPRVATGSALVRLRRLHGSPSAAAVMPALHARDDAAELAARGLRRMLLSAWARSRGMIVDDDAVADERRRWLSEHVGVGVGGGGGRGRGAKAAEAFLRQSGLDEGSLRVLLEDVLLERAVLQDAQRWIGDGPSFDEALAAEARLNGLWAALTPPLRAAPSGTSRGRGGSAPPSASGGRAKARRRPARPGS